MSHQDMLQLFDFELPPYRSNGSIRSGRPLVAKTQNAGDDEAQRLIHRDEKKAGEQNHENNKPRRDQGLAARRPSDLGTLGADLLKEFQGISHFFGVPSITKLLEAADSRKCLNRITPRSRPRNAGNTRSWQKASPKNQGAEPEGRAPQFSFIINGTRNANSIFLAGRSAAHARS